MKSLRIVDRIEIWPIDRLSASVKKPRSTIPSAVRKSPRAGWNLAMFIRLVDTHETRLLGMVGWSWITRRKQRHTHSDVADNRTP